MISSKFFLSIINKVNPLWLPNENDEGCVFTSYTDCYVYFMDKCYDVAPKGYMDVFVLLVGLYNWSFNKAVGFFKTYGEERIGDRITLIKVGDLKSKAFYRKFITCMHEYYHTQFDLQAFSQAWEIHKNHVLSKQLNVLSDDLGINNNDKGKKTKAEGNS